jgi:2-(1,2-epoxy-1,2-dihydrophenyl)acetyl-CoA isomerase
MSGQVLFARHGPVGLITLNRPEKLNAFADRMRDELGDVVQAAGEDQAIRALVITGAGRAFCAGADVARMYELVTNEDWDALAAFIDAGARVVRFIAELGKPVLAAVNGAAAGGGANLALACDIRIAATSASIGQTFSRLGLHPDWGGTYVLPRLLGLGRALELAFTGDMLPAAEAAQLGVFNRVVGDDRVVSDTIELADRLGSRPPLALAAAKQSIRTAWTPKLAEVLAAERRTQMRLLQSADARDAMRAFLEKRRPSFNGT